MPRPYMGALENKNPDSALFFLAALAGFLLCTATRSRLLSCSSRTAPRRRFFLRRFLSCGGLLLCRSFFLRALLCSILGRALLLGRWARCSTTTGCSTTARSASGWFRYSSAATRARGSTTTGSAGQLFLLFFLVVAV